MAAGNIIGRKDEEEHLLWRLSHDEGQFIAVYGRRGTGKTFFVEELLGERIDLTVTGIPGGSRKDELHNFSRELSARSGQKFPFTRSWMDAFRQLRSFIETRKEQESIIVFLDELQWMDTPKSRFLTMLGHFWNSYGNWVRNFRLIIASSDPGWMIQKVFGDPGELYGRIVCRLWLRPFTLRETEELLQRRGFHLDRRETLLAHMLTGGVPYFLTMLDPKESLAENTERLFFSPDAPLCAECESVLSSLSAVSEGSPGRRILELLAQNDRGLRIEEITKALKPEPEDIIQDALQGLEESGLTRVYGSFRKRKHGAVHCLSDSSLLFCLRFVRGCAGTPPRSRSDAGERRTWMNAAFAISCLRHMNEIREAAGISRILVSICVWQPEGRPVLVFDRGDRAVSICEIEYSESPLSAAECLPHLQRLMEQFRAETRTKKALKPVMIAPYGIDGITDGWEVQCVTLDDLFREVSLY